MMHPAELATLFVAGALGSSHCLGMCGPLALALGATSHSASQNLKLQLVYSAGRITTYSLLGAMAGFAGWRLESELSDAVPVQAILALVAGLALVIQGLASAGLVRLPVVWASGFPCGAARLLRNYLATPGWTSTLLAGAFTGFLPCGLVYAFLALACSSQNMFSGTLQMAAFGMGTVPLMVTAGCAGSVIGLAVRKHFIRLAGWSVVFAGVVSVWRGVEFLTASSAIAACPFCP